MRRCVCALMLLGIIALVQAAPEGSLEGVPAGLVRAVEEATGGRVLAARPAERDGLPGIRFRVLTPDGKVRHIWRPLPRGRE